MSKRPPRQENGLPEGYRIERNVNYGRSYDRRVRFRLERWEGRVDKDGRLRFDWRLVREEYSVVGRSAEEAAFAKHVQSAVLDEITWPIAQRWNDVPDKESAS